MTDGSEKTPVEIFLSYAHDDEELMNDVRRQLIAFERAGKIVKWHDREIPSGTEWKEAIDERLNSADVILLFVSPAFIESRYCYDVEVGTALQRHEKGQARVIPIILRPCAWEQAPFARLQALPRDAKPVSQWSDQDQVCLDIARSVMEVVDELAKVPEENELIFPDQGAFGPNILSEEHEEIEVGREYSLAVEVPPGREVEVEIVNRNHEGDNSVPWGMPVGKAQRMHSLRHAEGRQRFRSIEAGLAQTPIIFREQGAVEITIKADGQEILRKDLRMN